MIDPPGVVLLLRVIAVVAILSELLPRTVTLWHLWNYPDGLWPDRLFGWLKSFGFALLLGYEVVIWADLKFAQQDFLGTFAERWAIDVVILSIVAAGAVSVSALYWTIARRQDRNDIEDARLGGKQEPDPS